MKTLREYVGFLIEASTRYPLHGVEAMFSTDQNSISQTLARYFGIQPWVGSVSAIIRSVLAVMYVAVIIAVRKCRRWDVIVPMLLGSFLVVTLMLSQFEELILGGVIFAYVQAGENTFAKRMVGLYLIYVFLDVPLMLADRTKNMLFTVIYSTPLLLMCAVIFLLACFLMALQGMRAEKAVWSSEVANG